MTDYTIAEIYQFPSYHPKGQDIGVEVEVEALGGNLPTRLQNWRIVDDGSLRYISAEYVSRQPRSLKEIEDDIQSLCRSLSKNEHILKDSPRTSVHVHVNQHDYTPQQVLMHAYQWFLLEEILIKYCGKTRDSNIYCLTLQQAPGIIDIFRTNGISAAYAFHRTRADTHKYGALNLHSVYRIGTLEARTMRGVYDPEILKTWVRTVYKILTEHPYSSVHELLENATEDPTSFIKTFLPEVMYKNLDMRDCIIDLNANAAILDRVTPKEFNEEAYILDRYGSMKFFKESLTTWRSLNDPDKSVQQQQPVRTATTRPVRGEIAAETVETILNGQRLDTLMGFQRAATRIPAEGQNNQPS